MTRKNILYLVVGALVGWSPCSAISFMRSGANRRACRSMSVRAAYRLRKNNLESTHERAACRCVRSLHALLTVGAAAQAVLKREPGPGGLRPGERVLVDDGSCPRGQIKEVIGGSGAGPSNRGPDAATQRIRRCIAR